MSNHSFHAGRSLSPFPGQRRRLQSLGQQERWSPRSAFVPWESRASGDSEGRSAAERPRRAFLHTSRRCQRPRDAPGPEPSGTQGKLSARWARNGSFCSLLRLHLIFCAGGAALPPLSHDRWGGSLNQGVGSVGPKGQTQEAGKKPARWGRGRDFPESTCRIWGDENWFLVFFCSIIMYQN